jgi:hypothetical protein
MVSVLFTKAESKTTAGTEPSSQQQEQGKYAYVPMVSRSRFKQGVKRQDRDIEVSPLVSQALHAPVLWIRGLAVPPAPTPTPTPPPSAGTPETAAASPAPTTNGPTSAANGLAHGVAALGQTHQEQAAENMVLGASQQTEQQQQQQLQHQLPEVVITERRVALLPNAPGRGYFSRAMDDWEHDSDFDDVGISRVWSGKRDHDLCPDGPAVWSPAPSQTRATGAGAGTGEGESNGGAIGANAIGVESNEAAGSVVEQAYGEALAPRCPSEYRWRILMESAAGGTWA